jgi:hypothetical protein
MNKSSAKFSRFRHTLVVAALCLGLSGAVVYLTDLLTTRDAEAGADARQSTSTPTKTEHIETPAEQAMRKERELYGSGYQRRYRIGSLLEFGDRSMLCDFRADFMADIKKHYGDRIEKKEMPVPSTDVVVTEILRSLTLRLRDSGRDDDDVRMIAEYLGTTMVPDKSTSWRFWTRAFKPWKDARGFWTISAVDDYKESEQLRANRADAKPDEASYRAALTRLPRAYALYFDSLEAERTRAIEMMDALLALSKDEACGLRAVARYRRARLTMSLEDWAQLTDSQAGLRLRAIRDDLTTVPVLAAEGELDPGNIAENTAYWLAYLSSMILPTARLVRLDEADLPSALATYLRMPMRGDANAVNSCFHLMRKLCDEGDFTGCAKDPDMRRLITFYLAAGGSNNAETFLSHAELRKASAAWLDALDKAGVSPEFDPTRIAMLQHVARRWTDCIRTVELLPAGDPLRRLMASRCNLRLTGDLALSRRLLDPTKTTSAKEIPRNGSRPVATQDDDHDFTVLIDFNNPQELRDRAVAERGMAALCQGDFSEAFRCFAQAGFTDEADYVGECLLTTEEYKGEVERFIATKSPAAFEGLAYARPKLVSRLFRDGRMDEALEYADGDYASGARSYVLYLRLAQRTDLADRTRADAYWRAAQLIEGVGETILSAPMGLSWSSYTYDDKREQWFIGYGFLPYRRLGRDHDGVTTETMTLVTPSQEETTRLNSWLAAHVDKPVRSERDARYAAFDLALKAARLLPDNDPAGGQILQYAGNLLKYREPKAANPAYRLLVTRFKETPYGAYALKAHWFSAERPSPSIDVISR